MSWLVRDKIGPGQIYDSNSALLNALLQRCCAGAKSVEHCCDDRESLTEAIKRGTKNQLLIISGGVSNRANPCKNVCLTKRNAFERWPTKCQLFLLLFDEREHHPHFKRQRQ